MTQHHQAQWSDIVAVKKVESEDGPEGRTVLLVPKFRHRYMQWLQNRIRRKFFRIKLDEFGTFVWQRLDGHKCASEIAREMREHFGERAEPADDRLKKFLIMLHKDRFVELFQRK